MKSDNSSESIELINLGIHVTRQHWKSIVRTTLDYIRKRSTDVTRTVKAYIRKNVQVSGFRDPLKADTELLVRGLSDIGVRDSSAQMEILSAWLEANRELEECVQQVMPLNAKMETEDENRHIESLEDDTRIQELTELVVQGQPHVGREDVRVMIRLLDVTQPLREENHSEREIAQRRERELSSLDSTDDLGYSLVRSSKLRQWIIELEELTPSAPEWEEISVFTGIIGAIAEKKVRELEDLTLLSELRALIDTLQQRLFGEIAFFEMHEIAHWTGGSCTFESPKRVIEEVADFVNVLTEHAQLRVNSESTYAKDQERLHRLDQLATAAVAAYQRLCKFFRNDVGDSTVPSHGQSGELPQTSLSVEKFAEDDSLANENEIAEPSTSGVTEALSVGWKPSIETKAAQSTSEPPRERLTLAEQEVSLPPTPESLQPASDEPLEAEISAQLTEDLLPLQPAAQTVPVQHARVEWDPVLHALVAEDDLAAAYWLSFSLEAQSFKTVFRPWILAGAQGARWTSLESARFVNDLIAIPSTYSLEGDNEEAQLLLGLASAIKLSLIAPYSSFVSWLKAPRSFLEIGELVNAVTEFCYAGTPLTSTDLFGATGAQRLEENIVETASDAKKWLAEAGLKGPNFKRASDVWRHLTGTDGSITAMLTPVAEDRRGEVGTVREILERMRDRDYVVQDIQRIDRKLAKLKRNPIVGAAREHLVRLVKRLAILQNFGLRPLSANREIREQGQWRVNHVAELKDKLRDLLPIVDKYLADLSCPEQASAIRSAASCLRRSIHDVGQMLQIEYETEDGQLKAPDQWKWLSLDALDLNTALGKRLALIPGIIVDDSLVPSKDCLAMIPDAILSMSAQRPSVRDSFWTCLQRQDYFLANVVIQGLSDEIDLPELRHQYEEALSHSISALKACKDEAIREVEKGVLDGVISEDRSEYLGRILPVDADNVTRFKPYFDLLKTLTTEVDEKRQKMIKDLSAQWEALKVRVEKLPVNPELRQAISEFVEGAFSSQNTRVLLECLQHLSEVVGGSDLQERLFYGRQSDFVFNEFQKLAPAIEKLLESSRRLEGIAEGIFQGLINSPIAWSSLPKNRRSEVYDAIMEWSILKKRKPSMPQNFNSVARLLNYMGFELSRNHQNSVSRQSQGPDWLHVTARMTASNFARPIPQFGSMTQDRYHILVIWERPGADTMASRILDLRIREDSMIMLYLGRLRSRDRLDLARVCREQELKLAVLDEILFFFLGRERDTRARLPIFLQCALPYSAVNPYQPYAKDALAPEMFFGRDRLSRDLQSQTGTSLVYGGRQLGKSALLRHVKREFDNVEQQKYAWVEEISHVGDPLAPQSETSEIWKRIRDGFKDRGLISQRVITDQPTEILKHIRNVMDEARERRVLVLFDEADNFLEADAKDNFHMVGLLRSLMVSTESRFKIVFAGTHNVQRFQGIPNQPLSHFGIPICVGPLDADAACKLVSEPLRTVGFLADEATMLLILSYTNYHPGLIQLFCMELLNRLYKGTGDIPYIIQRDDVEKVYLMRKVRDTICERFDLTLALDDKYKTVAWSMIVDQKERGDGFSAAYPPVQLLEFGRYWWPQGFREVTIDELRATLEEMSGLGVLVRDVQGNYRLRSPNLVGLMGSVSNIETRLLGLSEKQPTTAFRADSHHALLDRHRKCYSPLTYSQERVLNQPRFGVGLIFGSEALGVNLLPSTFRNFVHQGSTGERAACQQIPSEINSPEELHGWLDRSGRGPLDVEHVVAYFIPRSKNVETLGELVQGAVKFCQARRTKSWWLRVFFILDSEATWQWFGLPESKREALENVVDTVVACRQWDTFGIVQLLAHNEKVFNEEICEFILEVTGGWHILLDHLLENSRNDDDPRPCAELMRQELETKDSGLRMRFLAAAGIRGHKEISRLMELISGEDSVPIDLVPDFLPDVPADKCSQALEYLQKLGCLRLHEEELRVDRVLGRAFCSG